MELQSEQNLTTFDGHIRQYDYVIVSTLIGPNVSLLFTISIIVATTLPSTYIPT